MQAVDSEHAKNVQSDSWRSFQLHKSLCRPDHPFSKFGSGNLETLRGDTGGGDKDKDDKAGAGAIAAAADEEEEKEKDGEGGKGAGAGNGAGAIAAADLRETLLGFHERYYSAGVMRLCVLGRESLDELQDLVVRQFSDVKDKGVSPPSFPGTPYRPEQLARRVRVVPVRESRTLDLSFPLREVDSLYLVKPTRYLSHLVGHEGRGSILSLLKGRGWANELSAGESRTCSDWSAFAVTIDLTDAGLDHVDDVAEIVFSYFNLLRDVGPQRWVHDETSTVAACSFRFLSKRPPVDYTCGVAGAMQLYPPRHVLSGPHKIWDFDPDLIVECLGYMTPRNCLVIVTAKKYEGTTDREEKWYGTQHSVDDLDPDLLVRWEKASVDSDLVGEGNLTLPERNDMIATDFDLRDNSDFPVKDEPRILEDTDTLRLWYKPDNVFRMPKLNVMARLRTPVAYETPESSVLALLYVEILREQTTEFSYLASMAGLHCYFVNAREGVELHVGGYNHRTNTLMGRIVKAIVDLPDMLDDDLFERIKDKVSKQYTNFQFAQPYQHAMYAADLCLEGIKWSVKDKASALETLTAEDVRAFSRRLLSRFHLEMLIHGNASPSEARAIASTLIDGLGPASPFPASLPYPRAVRLDPGAEYAHRMGGFNPDDTNSCLETLYVVGRTDLRTNAALALLHHLMKEPAFNELRTEEQLGYIVHTSIKTLGNDVKALLVLIMSDSHDPVHLDSRVEAFIARFRSKMISMSDDEFRTNVDAVVESFLEKDKNLGEESNRYWSRITDRTYVFRRMTLLADEVRGLEREDVVRLYDAHVAESAPRRGKFYVQVFGKNHLSGMDGAEEAAARDGDDREVVLVKDPVEFKRGMTLYPLSATADVSGMTMRS